MAIKVFELAEKLDVPLAKLTAKAKELKITGLRMASSLTDDEEHRIIAALSDHKATGTLKKRRPAVKKKVATANTDAPGEVAATPEPAARVKKAEKTTENKSTDLLTPTPSRVKKKRATVQDAKPSLDPETQPATTPISRATTELTKKPPTTSLPAKAKPALEIKPKQKIKFVKKADPPSLNEQPVELGADGAKDALKTQRAKRPRRPQRYEFDYERRGVPLRKQYRRAGQKNKAKQASSPSAVQRKKEIFIGKTISISELSNRTGIKAGDIIKTLLDLGIMATINQTIDAETAQLVAQDLGIKIEVDSFNAESLLEQKTAQADAIKRPPVVTIMGHVDHGKTSLLDKIRSANVVAGEAGGITQHIGAYHVRTKEGGITFLDTPGHEAFTSMRARGANATDIVVLVVAANDGPKPQTLEAISHAKAADVPIMVAINKCDLHDANPEKTKQLLMEGGLVAESFGGDVTMINISAKTGAGIDELMSMIALQAETMELSADPKRLAEGIVIESRLDKIRGNLVSMLVQNGSLAIGQIVLAGTALGKVKAMFGSDGKSLAKVAPSIPVEMLGMDELPVSGDRFVVVKNDKTAKTVQAQRIEAQRALARSKQDKARIEDVFAQIKTEAAVNLNLILKTDVLGSLEAIKNYLNKWNSEKITIAYLHSSVGAITSSDVALAAASNAIIIGFNVRPDAKAKALSEQESVQIKIYNVIYNLFSDIKQHLEGLIEPVIHQTDIGKAEVLEVFTIPKVGVVAGCKVKDGKVVSDGHIRILRDNIVIHTDKVTSLKRFKDDAKEVFAGFECGIMMHNFKNLKAGDLLEVYSETKQAPSLAP